MLDERIILALNGTDDAFLEETAAKLGYGGNYEERTTAMNNHPRAGLRRFISVLAAACLLLSLGIAAYAADLFGIQALLIKDRGTRVTLSPDSALISVTQPQAVPETMPEEVRKKIENSTLAWAEWDAWRRENAPRLPENCIPPDNVSSADYTENPDGTWTVTFYEGIVDGERKIIESRVITAEEHAQEQAFWETHAKGFEGYDFNYHVETQAMADKLEEIAAKYGLGLRRERRALYQDFGTGGFNTREEVTAEINRVCAGGKSFFRTEPTGYDKFYYFDEGTFAISFFTDEKLLNGGTYCYLYNSPYATLSSGFEIVSEIPDISSMSEYTHTTPDGTELTVLCSGESMYAYVYLESSFVTLSFHQPAGLSADEINAIIDMVDFSVIE